MSAKKPNVLLIFTDQQRADTIAALGNKVIKTPNLDSLCSQAIAFTSAYSPSPVCVPARCSLHYGQYPQNTECYENHYSMPTDNRPSFVSSLTDAGYRTHGVGKCHFTPDSHALRGFETRVRQEEIVDSSNGDEYLKDIHGYGYDYICDPHGVRGQMYYIPQVSQLPAELHPTQWIAEKTLEFLDEQENSSQPWMCFCSFVHPHPPFAPPNPWHKLYLAKNMPLPNMPDDYESLYTFINRRQNRYKYRDRGIDLNLLRCMKAYYYAAISFIDYQIGRILKRLEQTERLDDTLIIFTSDHGEHLGDYNCFGKRSMHDTASRVPMVVKLPGSSMAGKICNQPVSLVDVAPTILSACGVSLETGRFDGVNLLEIVSGACSRNAIFAQWEQEKLATYMCVMDDWKYFYSAADNKEFLFNRANDPLETKNIACHPEVVDVQKNIKRILMDFLAANGETAGISDGRWKEFEPQKIDTDPDSGLLVQDHPWANQLIPGYTYQ